MVIRSTTTDAVAPRTHPGRARDNRICGCLNRFCFGVARSINDCLPYLIVHCSPLAPCSAAYTGPPRHVAVHLAATTAIPCLHHQQSLIKLPHSLHPATFSASAGSSRPVPAPCHITLHAQGRQTSQYPSRTNHCYAMFTPPPAARHFTSLFAPFHVTLHAQGRPDMSLSILLQ